MQVASCFPAVGQSVLLCDEQHMRSGLPVTMSKEGP